MKRMFCVLLMMLTASAASAAEVKNISVRPSGLLYYVQYDLLGTDGEKEANVSIYLKIKGKRYPADELTLSGDLGKKVSVGVGKTFKWDSQPDFPAGFEGKPEWDVEVSGKTFKDPTSDMKFVAIKGGCYQMGDIFGDGDKNAQPVHEVCVSDFSLAAFDVTKGDFRQFVNDTDYITEAEKGDGCMIYIGSKWKKAPYANWLNPGFDQNDSHPVVCVSWNDAAAYIEWLNGKSGKQFRLPTEAEWEYAARSGGKRYKYAWGNGAPSGNVGDETHKRHMPTMKKPLWEGYDDGYVFTSPVGTFKPNELGLYDMTGNLRQWCQDWYSDGYFKTSPRNDPKGPAAGDRHALRGSSWMSSPDTVPLSTRVTRSGVFRASSWGFRLAISPQ